MYERAHIESGLCYYEGMEYFTDHSFDIKKFKYWTLILNYDQYYLGRTICYLNTYKENISDLAREEYLELLEIIKAYQTTLTKLWQPDRWNYVQLGNVVPHLHFHFIPRYKDERIFEGTKFIDEQWGKNYTPTKERPKDEILNEKIRLAILGALE